MLTTDVIARCVRLSARDGMDKNRCLPWILYCTLKQSFIRIGCKSLCMSLEARNFHAILDEPISNSGERCLVVLTKFRQDISSVAFQEPEQSSVLSSERLRHWVQ
jgi:hypothetical protein